MVHNAPEILLTWVHIESPVHLSEESFRDRLVSAAYLLCLDANVLGSNVLVVAQDSQALRQDNDGISLDNKSSCSIVGEVVEVFGVKFIGDSG